MARSIKNTIRGFFLIGLGILLGHVTSADADQRVGTGNTELKYHQTIRPPFNPAVGEDPCQQEAQAYVVALDVVDQANALADAAYMAWMECSQMGKSKSATEQLNDAPKNSILVRD